MHFQTTNRKIQRRRKIHFRTISSRTRIVASNAVAADLCHIELVSSIPTRQFGKKGCSWSALFRHANLHPLACTPLPAPPCLHPLACTPLPASPFTVFLHHSPPRCSLYRCSFIFSAVREPLPNGEGKNARFQKPGPPVILETQNISPRA